jgi:putative permease
VSKPSIIRLTNPEFIPSIIFLFILIGSITITYPYLKAAYFALILTYLLIAPHRTLVRAGCNHLMATILLMLLLTSALLCLLFIILPMLSNEMVLFIKEIPSYVDVLHNRFQEWLITHPNWNANHIPYNIALKPIQSNLVNVGRHLLEVSFQSLFSLFNWMMYCIVVPILTALILNDRALMLPWITQWLPKQHTCLKQFFKEIDQQMGFYLRGKVIEFLIVATLTTLALSLMHMNYALLMGILVGASVFIPIVGLFIVVLPIVIIGLMQWGFSAHFAYTMLFFTLIMLADAYLIIPVLFSGSMALHPAVILIAILCFGGLFGFWGILLALPLATVVRALLRLTRESLAF